MMSKSSTTTEPHAADNERLEPIPPGEVLLEEFMKPMGLSQNRVARDIGVPIVRVHEIVHGRRGITADTALRLACYFQTSAEFWLNLQGRYDLKNARRKAGDSIAQIVRPLTPA